MNCVCLESAISFKDISKLDVVKDARFLAVGGLGSADFVLGVSLMAESVGLAVS